MTSRGEAARQSSPAVDSLVVPEGAEGLSSVDAARRLRADGPNRIAPSSSRGALRKLLGPLSDPMVALLLVAAPTYLLIGEKLDAAVAFAALVPIAAVGWVLESRARRTLEALRALTAPTALVSRDGHAVVIRTEEVVVGDLVWLHEGDIVPADAGLIDLTQLTVDESSLTGESMPVAKVPGGSTEEATVWAGTTVIAGRALARVTATGAATRYGRIGSLIESVRPPATPLQRALGRLVTVLAVVAFVFCAAVVASELIRGNGWGDAVIAGVSLGIAAIPEEFSMVYALYLALGARQLARDRALVRRLPGVETLGSTTVICTDKTGTLTAGRLAVASLVGPDGGPADGRCASGEGAALLEAAVLACEPDPFDPLDVAITEHAADVGADISDLQGGALVTDWPFDPVHKYLTHVWELPDGTHRVASKGAIEGVLAHCEADPEVVAAAHRAHDALGAEGMRVIAVASGAGSGPSQDRTTDEAVLRYAGLVAFRDPIREGVGDALEECRTAGLRVVMITGDHPTTAHAVAEGLELPHQGRQGDLIASGDDLDGATDEQFDELAATTNIFARTRPDQKHRLVEALRRRGEVVAMTGDGVNDAAALHAADIGIAMGQRGTEVARDAATIVLLDDNFATIVAAVRNGRRIYDNLTRAFAYLIAFHPPLLFAALAIPLMGRPLLLFPVNLVLLELVLHPIVSVVFQADPADADVMRRPPRSAVSGLGITSMWRPYAIGLTLAVGICAVYLVTLDRGWPSEKARALAFVTLLCSQPFLIAIERSPDGPLWRTGLRLTPQFMVATSSIAAVAAAAVYVAPFADLLHLAPFPPSGWAVALAIAAITTLWAEPLKGRGPSGSPRDVRRR